EPDRPSFVRSNGELAFTSANALLPSAAIRSDLRPSRVDLGWPRHYHSRPAFCAQMAELVDALVSGTSTARCGGSSPLLGTRLRSRSERSLPRRRRAQLLLDKPTFGKRRARRRIFV